MVQHPAVGVAGPFLERLQDVGAGHRHAPGQPDGVRLVAELAVQLGVEAREVEHEGEHQQVGGEEEVRRHVAGVAGRPQRVDAEEVRHEGDEVAKAREELAQRRHGALGLDGEQRLDGGAGGDEVVERDGRERRGADRRREGGQEGALRR